MAGLLDIFNQRSPDDPVNMGLLNMSAALGTPVRQGGGVGPAFGAFGQGYQNSQQAEMRRRLMEAQIEETRAQAAERLKPRKEAPIPVSGGYIDPATGQSVRTELPRDAKEPALTELAKLVRERDALPLNSPARAYYDDAIKKVTTREPPVSVQVGLQSPYAGLDANGNPIVIQPPNKPGHPGQVLTAPDGSPIRPMPKDSDTKPPTEFESKAGLYATSMRNASVVLDQLEATGASAVGAFEAFTPIEDAKNVIRSPGRQSYVQAQRQWIDSINRVRSGANLPEIEYERAVSTFFPKYGDNPAAIKQKQEARKKEEEAMVLAAGRATSRVPGAPGAPDATPPAGNPRVVRYDKNGKRIP